MDSLSSLFSKKFKKDPLPPQFHGINEDLYEGNKLISKRRRTKNKIAQGSPLLEGFANQLDDVTLSEDQETTELTAELQNNLSSYTGDLKVVLSDYVNARREEANCKERCNNLTASPPQCNEEDVTGCTTCTSCYSQGPGWWCSDTGRCSTRGNPCTESCGQGGYQATPPSVQCPAEFPYLRDYPSGTGREWFCYAEPNGNSTGAGGLCNCACDSCGRNNNFGNCSEWGGTCSNADQQDTEATETTNKKQACLAGCGLSKAYLEPTEQVGTFENETINECAELAPPPEECNDCTYGRSDFWGDYGYNYNFGLEPAYWRQEVCTEQDAGTGCCRWVPDQEICTGYGCGIGYCEQVKDTWCPGGRGPDADPPCNDSPEGQMRLAACNNSDTTNTEAINLANEGRNLTQEYSNLKGEYLSDDQSTPEQSNVLMGDGNSISGRISNILGLRQELKANNDTIRTDLTGTLSEYQRELALLKKDEQDLTTIKAMVEDGKLNKRSASYKYYIWLGLAICIMMVAIRQLKK
jgi:hypothetical protein